MSETTELSLEATRVTTRSMKVRARVGGDLVHADVFDVDKAAQRKRFGERLKEQVPQADLAAVEAELLRIADEPDPQSARGDAGELDVSSIVRPEQFYTPEVTGLSVPVVTSSGGQPSPGWLAYLHWADGRRESVVLPESIDLPDGRRLWVHPTPGEPPMSSPSPWSSSARRAWLDGNFPTDAAGLFRRLCEMIARFIDLPPESASGTTATLALWVMLTYGYRAWGAVPYLYVGGPLGSGKSRLFDSTCLP
jgi:hypothetical protein